MTWLASRHGHWTSTSLEADKKIENYARRFPSLLEELNLLAQLVHRDAPNPSDSLRPMYWDFHINQLLAQDGKVAFSILTSSLSEIPYKILPILSWTYSSVT